MKIMSYRLKDIYIGDPDGLAEARKKNFTNYFYTKNRAYKELSENPEKFIVTGRKGTGKTILAKYYESQQKQKGRYCKYIDKDDVLFRQLQAIGNGEIPQRERATFSKYVLLIEIGGILLENKKTIIKGKKIKEKFRIKKAIRNLDKLVVKDVKGRYELKEFQAENEKFLGVKVGGKPINVANTKKDIQMYSETAYYNFIEQMKNIIFVLSEYYPITLIIDDLDEYDEKMQENAEFARFLSKFIEVTYKLNIELQEKNQNSKVILLVRSDLLKILHNESTNLNKFSSGAAIVLDWIKGGSGGYSMQHMLIDMICTKIRASIDCLKEKTNDEIMNELFPEKIKGDSFLKYILKYSHGRPRDIVNMLRIIIRENQEELCFTEKMFLDCEADYSKNFCDELRNEMALYYDGEYIKQCFQFLNLINRSNFNFAHAEKVYLKCKARLEKINDIEECFSILYRFGVIGNVSGTNPNLRYSFGYREDGHDIFNNCERITIHFALRKDIV